MAFIIFIGILVLVSVISSLAKGFEKEEAEARKKFTDDLQEADNGNINTQYEIGLKYLKGNGVERDNTRAFYWFEKAANQNHIEAQFSSGRLYARGKGIQENDTKAAYWYEKAAEQGHIEAQYRLANIYESGKGLNQDQNKAFKWTKTAASSGHIEAQYSLGLYYLNGQVVERSEDAAAQWFEKAAKQGNIEAQYNIGYMYTHGLGIAKDATKATQYLLEAAKKNHIDAQYLTGLNYLEGNGIKQSDYEAKNWIKKASKKGQVEAQFLLGKMHLIGKEAHQSDSEAFSLFLKAAKQGHGEASQLVAQMYQEGKGVEKDVYQAEEWMERAKRNESLNIDKLNQKLAKEVDESKEEYIPSNKINDLLEKVVQQPKSVIISIACRFDALTKTIKTLSFSGSFNNFMTKEEAPNKLKNITIVPHDELANCWFNDGISLVGKYQNLEESSAALMLFKTSLEKEGCAIDVIQVFDQFMYDIEKTDIPIVILAMGVNLIYFWLGISVIENSISPKSKTLQEIKLAVEKAIA